MSWRDKISNETEFSITFKDMLNNNERKEFFTDEKQSEEYKKYSKEFDEFNSKNHNHGEIFRLTPKGKLNIIKEQYRNDLVNTNDISYFNKASSLEGKELNGIPFKSTSKKEILQHASSQNNEKFQNEPKNDPARVGVVIMEPDGRMWIHKPSDKTGKNAGYNGKKYEFSRGEVEYKKESNPKGGAIIEAYEEMGLKIEVTDYLCDDGQTRYYIAKRIGGSPNDFEYESDGVMLATPEKLQELFAKNSKAQDLNVLNKAIKYQEAHKVRESTETRTDAITITNKAQDNSIEVRTDKPDYTKEKDLIPLSKDSEKVKPFKDILGEKVVNDLSTSFYESKTNDKSITIKLSPENLLESVRKLEEKFGEGNVKIPQAYKEVYMQYSQAVKNNNEEGKQAAISSAIKTSQTLSKGGRQ